MGKAERLQVPEVHLHVSWVNGVRSATISCRMLADDVDFGGRDVGTVRMSAELPARLSRDLEEYGITLAEKLKQEFITKESL